MSKTKELKKLVCLMLFCLLSINSFAATVSDNDGSAFLTKGEFDSAKTQFLDRINQYRTNIDSLIDTAISSYLTGIQLGKRSENALPLKSLKEVTCLGYSSIDDFKYPEFTVDYVILAEAQYDLTIPDHDRPSDANRWGIENWWLYAHLENRRGTNERSKRILITDLPEDTTIDSDTKVRWRGIAQNYLDTITISGAGRITSGRWNEGGGYLWGSGSPDMFMVNTVRLNPGYYENLNANILNIWGGRLFWLARRSASDLRPNNDIRGHGLREVPTSVISSVSTNIELKEVNEKVLDRENIITIDNITFSNVSSTDWAKTFTRLPDNSLTEEALLQRMTTNGTINSKYGVVEWWNPDHMSNSTTNELRRRYSDINGYFSGLGVSGLNWWTSDKVSTDKSVTLGLIGTDFTSDHIKQNSSVFEQKVDDEIFVKKDIVLDDGFPLLAAKKDDVIEWTAYFDKIYYNKEANDDTDDVVEVDLWLSVGPFDSGTTSSKLIKLNDQTTANKVTSELKKCKIKFTMPESGIVFAKWMPHETRANYSCTLNLTNSANYYRTVKN